MVQGPGDPIEELLPAYALNALEDDERDLVERALAESPRYRAVLAGYLEGFVQLAESQVVLLPSLDLLDRIMAAVGARRPSRPAPAPASAPEGSKSWRRWGGWRPTLGRSWAVAAASVLVFVGLGGLAVAQSFRVNDIEVEMKDLSASAAVTQAMIDGQRAEMTELKEAAADTEAKLLGQQELTYLVAYESTTVTRMWAMATPEPFAKPARGMLIADLDGERLLMTLFLRPLEPSLVYQAWVWESDGSAFSIAVFVVDHSGYALVPARFPAPEIHVDRVSVHVASAGGEARPMGQAVLTGTVEYR